MRVNQWLKSRKASCRLKPGGYGPGAVRTRADVVGAGNSRAVVWVAVREATVTCCGVAVAMPQG